jgi:hypothetical protein
VIPVCLVTLCTALTVRAEDPQAPSRDIPTMEPVVDSKSPPRDEPKAQLKEQHPKTDAQKSTNQAPAPDSKARASTNPMSDDPRDPQNVLSLIEHNRTRKRALFPASPIQPIRDAAHEAERFLNEEADLTLGLSVTHLFQWLSKAPLSDDTWGTGTDLDFLAKWELYDRGGPTQGHIVVHVQGRWDYGTTGPEQLGTFGFGTLNGTANTFSAYSPAFLVRNLYWQQGSEEAGWAYRIGKITPDAMFGTSAHVSAATAFLSTTGVGTFANAYPDSGLGVAGVLYFNDRFKVQALISDANADRTDMGDILEGDFYKAIEFAARPFPLTSNAGYSKFAIWHTDGTEDGEPANGSLGPDGWGFFIKLEQELSTDGRLIGIAKYGQSFDKTAFYEQQAGISLLYYNPLGI